MQLPPPLRQAIAQELTACNSAQLHAAASKLSDAYRQSNAAQALATEAERAAYLAVRMPATYAAVTHALRWTRERFPEEIHSALDLGSGPGTALWAASEAFPSLASCTAVERNSQFAAVARRMAQRCEHPALRSAEWITGDASVPQGSWDLVLCSYVLNELSSAQRAVFLGSAWGRTAKLLVLIEPGTTAGFANILSARTQLLRDGARIIAPCPNQQPCPMASDDWCHFAARVERTAEHRRLKDAELGHEDEKFSYMAVVRDGCLTDDPDAASNSARILRHPRIFSGYAQLTLCAEGKIAQTTVTRSHKDDWRRLKRLGWGDRW